MLFAAHTSVGISYDSFATLVVVVLILSVLNLFVKPLLILFTLPFVIVSLGLGIWLINAILLLLVGKIVGGFEVASLGSALWGALVISLTSLVANLFGRGKVSVRATRGARTSVRPNEEDVIDV